LTFGVPIIPGADNPLRRLALQAAVDRAANSPTLIGLPQSGSKMSVDVQRRQAPRKQPQPPAADGSAERQRLWMMMLIRRFEERTYQEYTKPGQRIGGFCHLYSGQEAVAVGIAAVLQKGKDNLINAYRDHGHALALGMDPKAAMAEMFGRVTGCSKGKGGSMHLFDAAAGNMGGHGIVGGHLPLGVGIAFACWYKKTGGVCFTLFGDGALNQGSFNEAMNLASLMNLPCIFICENNGMAMGTHVHRSSAEPDLVKRGLGYAMPCKAIDGNDIDEVMREIGEAAARARRGEGPSYLVANTYRYRGHSMSDAMKYRTREELEKARQRDPIVLYQKRLRDRNLIDEKTIEQMEYEIHQVVDESVKFADQSPHPDLSELYTDVYVEQYPLEK
jgi:pyruvate dehydrogenase E1 component alpha subunit